MNAALDTAEVKVPEYGVYDVDAIRADFPALSLEINGYPIAFLDSGASAQKPEVVIERMNQAYRGEYANVHRGAYSLSQKATDNYEEARTKVARFVNAKSDDEIIFTRNVTAAINLVSHSYGRASMKATKSSSRIWNTMPISCPGNCCGMKPGLLSRSCPLTTSAIS